VAIKVKTRKKRVFRDKIMGMLLLITSTKNNDSSSPLRDVSRHIQLKILHKEKDQINIPQAPFPKPPHPQRTYKLRMTDPARLSGSPVEPQTSKVPSYEAQKHYIEVLMKTQHGQQGFCNAHVSTLTF